MNLSESTAAATVTTIIDERDEAARRLAASVGATAVFNSLETALECR